MQDNEKKPALRFKGFTDPWEQRKLGEIAKEVVRNDPASDAPIMMITAGNGFIEQSDRYAFNNAGESLKKYILLERGELAYNHGASKLRPYGSCFALTTVEKARIPFVYHCFSVEKSNPEFLSIELNGANVENQLRKIVSSGARMDGLLNIAYSEYTEVTVQLPKKEEQDWIAKFFKHLDTLITLHQRKYEKLVNIKKSMLDKMFPKNGASVPEIRFKGFTDLWEQRKLGEVFEEYSEKNHAELPPLTIIQGGGTIRRDESERALQYDKSSLSNYKMVNKDDFIVHLRSFEGGLEKASSQGIISPAYHTFHGEDVDSRFYYAYFRSKKFINKDLKPHVYGIRDGRSIDIEGMKTIRIPWASYPEQKSIGDFLTHLDTLITLHQRKLEKLQNIKKSCLEKMFV